MILLPFLASASAIAVPTLQRQLDYMVAICRVEELTRLVAHEGNRVEFTMVRPGHLPTVSETKAVQCVHGKLKDRPDLHIGFTGNDAAPKAKRK